MISLFPVYEYVGVFYRQLCISVKGCCNRFTSSIVSAEATAANTGHTILSHQKQKQNIQKRMGDSIFNQKYLIYFAVMQVVTFLTFETKIK